jgi:hypothetical protein
MNITAVFLYSGALALVSPLIKQNNKWTRERRQFTTFGNDIFIPGT